VAPLLGGPRSSEAPVHWTAWIPGSYATVDQEVLLWVVRRMEKWRAWYVQHAYFSSLSGWSRQRQTFLLTACWRDTGHAVRCVCVCAAFDGRSWWYGSNNEPSEAAGRRRRLHIVDMTRRVRPRAALLPATSLPYHTDHPRSRHRVTWLHRDVVRYKLVDACVAVHFFNVEVSKTSHLYGNSLR